MCVRERLHPNVNVVPVAVMTGAVTSSVQVMVLDTDSAVLAHASAAFHVRVCEREHPVTVMVLSEKEGVTGPQASATVAVPSAASMSAGEGLQPRVSVVPTAVITGAVTSSVQVMVLDTDSAVLAHASAAFHVRVCEREHPVTVMVLSEKEGVTGPQASATVAVPSAASMSADEGLHPRVSVVPTAVMTGAVTSSVQVMVLDTDSAVLAQASVAFHVLVCEREQPVTVTVLSEKEGVTGPQASATVAVPSAASMSAGEGLHPNVNVVPVAVMTLSLIHIS